nr:endonuclease/exonuclease/phosphatase family protein [Aurantimonas marina]
MNLRWSATDRTAAIRLIGELSPDVVTLQEARKKWRPLLQSLSARYPYRFDCTGPRAYFDVVILSRRPFATDEPGDCDRPGTFASRTVDFNGQALTIATQHLTWPWPGGQWRQLERLQDRLRRLRRLGTPVLIAGDFNAAPWSAALRTYAAASGTGIVPNVGPSWLFRPLTGWLAPYAGLPIDNVLVSPGVKIISVGRQPATGSDHLPLLVTFGVAGNTSGADATSTIVERQ